MKGANIKNTGIAGFKLQILTPEVVILTEASYQVDVP